MALRIASVVTLGTPHSGIFNNDTLRNAIAFPTGRDFPTLELELNALAMCGQISCHQAGQDMLDGRAATFFGLEDAPGELMPKLADIKESAYPFPAVNILSLIGLTTRRGGGDFEVDRGDALVTYGGQRFYPWDTMDGLTRMDPPRSLRHGVTSNIGASVSERILGFPDDTVPGSVNPSPGDGGYRHSVGVWGIGVDSCVNAPLGELNKCRGTAVLPPLPLAEPYVVCATVAECEHKALQEVLEWVSNHAAYPTKFAIDELVEVTVNNVPVLDTPNGEVLPQIRSSGDKGKVVSGPVIAGECLDRWWQVKFETGADGWVAEEVLRKVEVVNGVCGTTNNTCSAGSWVDVDDTWDRYRWNCVGTGTGTTDYCDIPRGSQQ